jgi:hypothetical protein
MHDTFANNVAYSLHLDNVPDHAHCREKPNYLPHYSLLGINKLQNLNTSQQMNSNCNTDTPRTDQLMLPHDALATNLIEHAREMERENQRLRDLLTLEREQFKKLVESL